MNTFLTFFLTFPFLLIYGIFEDEPHPVPAKDLSLACNICHVLKVGKDGKLKCVKRNRCCDGLNSYTSCLINPCLNYRKSCKRSKHCIINNCRSSGCYAIYYDENWIEIDSQYCNSREKLKLKFYQIPKEVDDKNRIKIFPQVSMKKFYHDIRKDKPGICDKNLQNEGEILKICTDNCKNDNDCSGQMKCCNNGCADLCTLKYKKIERNFLNMEIVVKDK
uniref:WAP domain-containing protein n=1 Tax=Strongyloides venezuelensis TaxID=75913 RepID=A0A0K0FYM1_STRVS